MWAAWMALSLDDSETVNCFPSRHRQLYTGSLDACVRYSEQAWAHVSRYFEQAVRTGQLFFRKQLHRRILDQLRSQDPKLWRILLA